MTAAPAIAGWTRDATNSAAAPLVLGAVMLVCVIASVPVLRLLQHAWPIVPRSAG